MAVRKPVLFVCLLAIVLVAGWAHCEDAIPPELLRVFADHMGRQMASWQAAADKHFPKPPVLIEYERVLDAYYAGRLAEELSNAEKLAAQPVILGSADAWAKDPQIYYEAYQAGRLLPGRAVIRRVWAMNRDYAKQLGDQNQYEEAIKVSMVNLLLAEQIAHIEPHDTSSVLSGLGLWNDTWRSLSEQLDAVGDRARARRAGSCAHQSMVYLRGRAAPVVSASGRRCDAFERELKTVPKSKQEAYARRRQLELIRADAPEDDRLVKLWDAEVDTVAAKQLVKELRKLSR